MFELSVSQSRNAVNFSIIAMPKRSNFTHNKTLCKTLKNTREFHLYCWDHVCKVNELCLVDFFHGEFRISTQIMVRDYCVAKCKKSFFPQFKIFTLVRILLEDFGNGARQGSLLFNILNCGMSFMIDWTCFTSYTNDSTPYTVEVQKHFSEVTKYFEV